MSRILPLPQDAISQIHSSRHITTLQGVILSLLENSLDAGATKINVTIEFHRGGCTVEDDGTGIPSTEFADGGGVGKLHHTSKHGPSPEHDLHGYAGSFLASLSALTLLGVTSTHVNGKAQSAMTIHLGKVISRQVRSLGEAEHFASSSPHGTSVEVRDLFGNMPVRVKQRAILALAGSSTIHDRPWEELKHGVVALILAWPKPVAVRVRDLQREDYVLNLAAQHPAVAGFLTEKALNGLSSKAIAKYTLQDALAVVFQAGLAPPQSRHSWVPLSANTLSFAIKGTISLHPVPTKSCQFISLGIHPCLASRGSHNEFYDIVNRAFAMSTFGAVPEDDIGELDEDEAKRRRADRRFKHDGFTRKQLQTKKGVDRHPMFVLQISLKSHSGNTARGVLERPDDTSVKSITDVLEAAVSQWLQANHFRPQKKRRRREEMQESPASAVSTPEANARPATTTGASARKKRRVVDRTGRPVSHGAFIPLQQGPSSYFDSLSRIKSGRSDQHEVFGKRFSALSQPQSRAATPLAVREPAWSDAVDRRLKPATPVEPVPQAVVRAVPDTSSDDFGSVDDSEMLALVTASEYTLTSTITTKPDVPAVSAEHYLEDYIVNWTDPVTKQQFRVNSRTGVVLPPTPRALATAFPRTGSDSARHPAAINTSTSSFGLSISLARRTRPIIEHSEGLKPAWLSSFLSDWENPVFAPQVEPRISVASADGPGIDTAEACGKRCTGHALDKRMAEMATGVASTLSTSALRRAKVIRQVDEKFILCLMPTTPATANTLPVDSNLLDDGRAEVHGMTVVLIDQHAASERVTLERLLADLCSPPDPSPGSILVSNLGHTAGVKTLSLQKPQRFQISEVEHGMFRRQALRFANWGIMYDLSTAVNTNTTASQVRMPAPENRLIVRALPPSIAERCSLFPKLLVELLRTELYATTIALPPDTQNIRAMDEAGRSWLSKIGSCPKGVLDLLNSRACRSAIMFNDVLSVTQCRELVEELSGCESPFVCAHGRVSMVPVVELGIPLIEEAPHDYQGTLSGLTLAAVTGRRSTDVRQEESAKFVHAFKRWHGVSIAVDENTC